MKNLTQKEGNSWLARDWSRHCRVEFNSVKIPRSSFIGESMVHHEPVSLCHPGSQSALALNQLTNLTATALRDREIV